jgi:alpha-D-xyloside xylohydrolase
MPYLNAAAAQVTSDGTPMMRAMALEFPADPACTYLDRQYMLGDDLLVAPVLSETGTVTFYVPDGVWTDVLSGEKIEGPRWVTQTHGYLTVPLLVRPGAVVGMGNVAHRPDYPYADGVTLRLYEIPDGARITTVVADEVFTTARTGDTIRVTSDFAGEWHIWHDGRTVSAAMGEASVAVWAI